MDSTAIWVAAIVYVIIGTGLAVVSKKGMGEGLSEFFLANRGVGGLVAAGTYSATIYSAFMTVGLAGFIYKGGVGALGYELLYLSGLFLVVLFGPRFWLVGKKYNYITPYEMLGDRYQSRYLPAVAGIAALIFLVPYSAIQLMGVGYLMEGLSNGNIPYMSGVIFATVLAVFWALIAGMRSVAWTDTLMALLMMGATVLSVLVITSRGTGGFVNLFLTLERDYAEFMAVPGPGFFNFKSFLAMSLPWFFFSLSTPHATQRLYISKSMKDLRRMLMAFLAFGFIYTFVVVVWGFSAKVILPGLENPDMATPTLLALPLMPTWIAILLMLGITAACISTVDSIMLTLSSIVSRDIYARFVPDAPERTQVILGQGCIVVLAVIFAIFASLKLNLIGLLSVASTAGLLSVVPPIIGAFFWKRGTAAGAISSIIAGGILSFCMQYFGWTPLGFGAGVWTIIVAGAVFIVVGLMTQPPTQKAEEFLDYLDEALAKRNAI